MKRVELYQKIRRAVMIDAAVPRWAAHQSVNLGFSHHLAYRDMAKNVWVRPAQKTMEICHFLDPNLLRRGLGEKRQKRVRDRFWRFRQSPRFGWHSQNGAEAGGFCPSKGHLIDSH